MSLIQITYLSISKIIIILASHIKLDLICPHCYIIPSCLAAPFTHTLPLYFGLHHVQRTRDPSPKPSGTKPHQHQYIMPEEVGDDSFQGEEKRKHHPTQPDCKETEGAQCAPARLIGLAGTQGAVATRSVHIWERLSIQTSSSAKRDLVRAVLLHSLVLISISIHKLPCHWESPLQQWLMHRCLQPKGTGLTRWISVKNGI